MLEAVRYPTDTTHVADLIDFSLIPSLSTRPSGKRQLLSSTRKRSQYSNWLMPAWRDLQRPNAPTRSTRIRYCRMASVGASAHLSSRSWQMEQPALFGKISSNIGSVSLPAFASNKTGETRPLTDPFTIQAMNVCPPKSAGHDVQP